MKNRLLHFSSVLLTVVLVSTVSSCRPPRKTQTAAIATAQPTHTPQSVAIPEDKPPEPVVKGEPYLSGKIRIIGVELVEKNARLRYDLNISYPQIARPRTQQERRFNLHVRRMIKKEVNYFKRFCRKYKNYPNGKRRDMEYQLETSFEVLYATPEFLSINLTQVSFTGYLNSDWLPVPLNYDLKTGRPVNLGAFFKPRSKFLKTIASYCIGELVRRGINGGSDEEWIRTGAAPKPANYTAWNLARNGLQINFGEYQVGAGNLGLVSVLVPYDHLKTKFRRDKRWLVR